MMFMRDMQNKKQIDTIILGSSIGLNNIDGITLEQESTVISNVLNMSAFSMVTSHVYQLEPLFSLFPNLKRVIYSAQSLDFNYGTFSGKMDIQKLKEYIEQDSKSSSLKYTWLAYKNFINIIKRRFTWEEKYMRHNSFGNLDFDHTGSSPLHIYGEDIIEKRWNNHFFMPTSHRSYQYLEKLIDKIKLKNIKFYFIAQPCRKELVRTDKNIKDILRKFHQKTEKISHNKNIGYLNLHKKLKLEDKYFADRIHLNDKGNKLVAKEIGYYIDQKEKEALNE